MHSRMQWCNSSAAFPLHSVCTNHKTQVRMHVYVRCREVCWSQIFMQAKQQASELRGLMLSVRRPTTVVAYGTHCCKPGEVGHHDRLHWWYILTEDLSDAGGKDEVPAERLVDAILALQHASLEDHLRITFELLDRRGDGTITRANMEEILKVWHSLPAASLRLPPVLLAA